MSGNDINSLKQEIEKVKDTQAEQGERLRSIETKLDLLIEGRIKPDPKYQSTSNTLNNKKFIIELIKAVSAGIAGAIAAAATLWSKINGQ